MKVADYCVFQP